MMASITVKEENIIKDVRNLLRLGNLKKVTSDTTIKNIRNLFKLKKKTKQLKTEYLDLLEIFLRIKKKIIINQYMYFFK